jgi:DNA invertase Pin-like site-specific DNA recombinase
MSQPSPLAVSYRRWSNPTQAAGDSLRRQTAAAEAYASAHGLTLLPISFLDAGLSAFRSANLKEGALGALIAAIEGGKLPRDVTIICESLDRITRADLFSALDTFRRILKLGATLVTLQDGGRFTWENTKENLGQMVVSLAVMARANEESRTKASRLSAAWGQKRKRAQEAKTPLGGKVPAWITFDGQRYSVIPAKGRTVALIYRWAAEGAGSYLITRRLAQQRVPTISRGARWGKSYVEKLLSNPAVVGTFQPYRLHVDPDTGQKRRLPDGDPIPGYFPAAIPVALYTKAQRQRVQRRLPSGPRGASVSNLLAGLLVCSCRGRVWRVNKGRRKDGSLAMAYDCRRRLDGAKCRLTPWPADSTERLVLTLLSRIIPWGRLLPQTRSAAQTLLDGLVEQEAALNVEREAVTLKLTRVQEAIEAGGQMRTLLERMGSLEVQRATLEQQAESVRGRVVDARATLASARETVDRQKQALSVWQQGKLQSEEDRSRLAAVLRDLVKRIELRPNRRLGIVLANGEEEDFVCEADCSAVYDLEGELVTSVSPP